jgi:hypothetical protein
MVVEADGHLREVTLIKHPTDMNSIKTLKFIERENDYFITA